MCCGTAAEHFCSSTRRPIALAWSKSPCPGQGVQHERQISSRADQDVSGRAPSPRVRTQHMGQALARFARYVEAVGHHGPLTVEVMAALGAAGQGGRGDRGTAARALRLFRPFTRWLQQFEPATEVPDEATFGPVPGQVTLHIFRDEEIEAFARRRRAAQTPPARSTVCGPCSGLDRLYGSAHLRSPGVGRAGRRPQCRRADRPLQQVRQSRLVPLPGCRDRLARLPP